MTVKNSRSDFNQTLITTDRRLAMMKKNYVKVNKFQLNKSKKFHKYILLNGQKYQLSKYANKAKWRSITPTAYVGD